jgi:acetoacetate decarboxylase
MDKMLTRDEIKSCGWECIDDSGVLISISYRIRKGVYVYEMMHNEAKETIKIINYLSVEQLYKGKCKSLRNLKLIMKWACVDK